LFEINKLFYELLFQITDDEFNNQTITEDILEKRKLSINIINKNEFKLKMTKKIY
tara:strand:+ start:1219 stop:1383 length:165 start_codon:yes stop_codon:yes gene_type:complete